MLLSNMETQMAVAARDDKIRGSNTAAIKVRKVTKGDIAMLP